MSEAGNLGHAAPFRLHVVREADRHTVRTLSLDTMMGEGGTENLYAVVVVGAFLRLSRGSGGAGTGGRWWRSDEVEDGARIRERRRFGRGTLVYSRSVLLSGRL